LTLSVPLSGGTSKQLTSVFVTFLSDLVLHDAPLALIVRAVPPIEPARSAWRRDTTNIHATGKTTQEPATIRNAAATDTKSLLTPQHLQPYTATDTEHPWENPAIWEPCLSSWNDENTKQVCALATEAEVLKLIHKGKINGAPGLDGIQYGALKLMLHADGLAKQRANLNLILISGKYPPETVQVAHIN
jgi:hypothetical protein